MNKMEKRIVTVSQVNTYIKNTLDSDMLLQNIWIQGEISNFKLHYSGHMYMSLKDKDGVLRAVMFRGENVSLPFRPENGMQVIAHGRISAYTRDGAYQLYIDMMEPAGAGALYMAFEQMKARLAAEGLFDEDKKKAIPRFPSRVGVVTSGTGAALQDILNILSRRWKPATVIVAPVLVQGEGASTQIANAIEAFNAKKAADVLIVGRGGGSIEDLWAFNEEITARAVAKSEIPIISAVGHETDFTICDFVADLRAPTPSAAAELAVPDASEIAEKLKNTTSRLSTLITLKMKTKQDALKMQKTRLGTLEHRIDDLRFTIDKTTNRMEHAMDIKLGTVNSSLASLTRALDALSPLKVLSRGYTHAVKENDAVKSINQVSVGDTIQLHLADGSADCEVLSIRGRE